MIKEQKGIALLISLVMIGAILLIVVSLTLMALQGLRVSALDEDSQNAYYAADSAVECLLYYHFHPPEERTKGFKKPGSEPDESGYYDRDDDLMCGKRGVVVDDVDDKDGDPDDPDKSITKLTTAQYFDSDSGPCADMEVERYVEDQNDNHKDITKLRVWGYSNCTEDTTGGVQRGLEVTITRDAG